MLQVLFFLLFLFSLPAAGFADGSVVTLAVENDLYVDEDNNYTSGVRLGWAGPENQAPLFLVDAAQEWGLLSEHTDKRWGFDFGQNMYSPTSLTNNPPNPNDRPYAGWLYSGLSFSGKKDGARETLGITFGVVGPLSLAAESQDFIHVLGGGIRPQGWGSQLKNEAGIILSYEKKWPSLFFAKQNGLELDFTPALGANLGNIHTHASMGGMVRFGQNLGLDEAPPLIKPSLQGNDIFSSHGGWGWYAFAGAEGRGVVRDIFLDGNTFENSASVDKNPFVASFQAGVAVVTPYARLAYTHALRSREFKTQDEADAYGALTLSWRY